MFALGKLLMEHTVRALESSNKADTQFLNKSQKVAEGVCGLDCSDSYSIPTVDYSNDLANPSAKRCRDEDCQTRRDILAIEI